MAQIRDDMHSKYVPTVTLDGVTEVLDHVIFDGDQLTEERARNAQWQIHWLEHRQTELKE